jgi:hypothetical protein
MFWLTFLRESDARAFWVGESRRGFIRPEALAAENRHGSPPELVPPIGANDTVQALARVNSLAQTADKIDALEVAAAVLKSMHHFPFQRFERRFHLYAG